MQAAQNAGIADPEGFECGATVTRIMGIDAKHHSNGNVSIYMTNQKDYEVYEMHLDYTVPGALTSGPAVAFNHIAGIRGQGGANNGPGTSATFKFPIDVQLSADQTKLYVSDFTINAIRQIDLTDVNYTVSTLHTYGSSQRTGWLTLDADGNLYMPLRNAHRISKISFPKPIVASPEIKSMNDYYAFGMVQPGRHYNADAYRFGFNGKEKDHDIQSSGNNYDYGFRIYNPRLGKFLSVDPLAASYPWYTPYQFAGNKPIWALDLDGLEELIFTYHYDVKSKEKTLVKIERLPEPGPLGSGILVMTHIDRPFFAMGTDKLRTQFFPAEGNPTKGFDKTEQYTVVGRLLESIDIYESDAPVKDVTASIEVTGKVGDTQWKYKGELSGDGQSFDNSFSGAFSLFGLLENGPSKEISGEAAAYFNIKLHDTTEVPEFLKMGPKIQYGYFRAKYDMGTNTVSIGIGYEKSTDKTKKTNVKKLTVKPDAKVEAKID